MLEISRWGWTLDSAAIANGIWSTHFLLAMNAVTAPIFANSVRLMSIALCLLSRPVLSCLCPHVSSTMLHFAMLTDMAAWIKWMSCPRSSSLVEFLYHFSREMKSGGRQDS